MVESSTYSRNHLKNRLDREGLNVPRCEVCGEGELWRGQPMSLILDHVYCSRACGRRAPRPNRGVPNPGLRRAKRPPYDQLLREIAETSYVAVGTRYGVSDNAIRKWACQYERERVDGVPPD